MTRFKSLVLVMMFVFTAVMMSSCDEITNVSEGLCGPCGTVTNGDATITGMAQLDGIFKAVGTLKASTGSIKGNFKADIEDLAATFGTDLSGAASIEDMVALVKADIEGQIAANVSGGINVKFVEPKCSASASVAVSASAQCEAKLDASCSATVECSGGELSFACEGGCSGSCEGTCSLPTCEVAVTGPSLTCEGVCKGGCAVSVTGACEGKCSGGCDADCSAYVDDGSGGYDCNGTCSGNCSGTCEVEAEAECSGECHGSCELQGPEAEASCTGDLGCKGSCEGSCSGSCEGEISAPSCEGQASCDADVSAKCEAQASAQASASLECTPPKLELDYNFNASLDAEGQVAFLAKMEEFKVKMIGIIKGMFELRTLVEGNAELDIEPPVVTIGAEIIAFGDALAAGDIEVEAVGLILCAIPAFEEAGTILGKVKGDVQGTLSGQISMMAIIM